MPDRDRVDGHVRLTRPVVIAGRRARDLTLTFRAGRVERVSGGDGVDAMRAYLARDSGTSRLGELALVDGASAVGSLGREFGFILFDENCASHVALGFAFPELVDAGDRDRLNASADHLDLMVGSDQVEAIGIRRDGSEQTLLRHGEWRVGR